jgi:ssRNA-specific RNase YbeY (16S rRNA maturation enzyme)
MIHGTLHLCGFNDTDKREKEIMRELENKWILKIKEN